MLNDQIAASILSADFARLGEEVTKILTAGADLVHFDVMDNHYVPNLTIGPLVCKALRTYGVKAPIDVHLMTEPVDSLIKDFSAAGASMISFHPEASKHVDRSLTLIRDAGLKAGLALNPATPIDCLDYVLDKIDFILVMSVNPGFAAQKFIPGALTKIATLKKMLQEKNAGHIEIEVDGGIKPENIAAVKKAGANIFVMGSALFGENDYANTITKIRANLNINK